MLRRISGGTSPRTTTAGPEDAERFGEHAILVAGQVDHAVRDDDVHEVVGQGDGLDFALQELDVLQAGLPLVLPRERQHLVRHIETVGFPGGADAPRGKEHVDAASRPEVEDDLARAQLRQAR
jgi:hypothetical protein